MLESLVWDSMKFLFLITWFYSLLRYSKNTMIQYFTEIQYLNEGVIFLDLACFMVTFILIFLSQMNS